MFQETFIEVLSLHMCQNKNNDIKYIFAQLQILPISRSLLKASFPSLMR